MFKIDHHVLTGATCNFYIGSLLDDITYMNENMLSGLWIYALYSTLKVDLTASLLDLYLVFFSM